MDPEECLQTTFGHSKFRLIQKQIIKSCLDGNDVLVLMPTGGGKSLCYQLPGVIEFQLHKKTTIVISPLRSLILDQISFLNSKGISAESITGEHSLMHNISVSQSFGVVNFIYTTPESLDNNQTLREAIRRNLKNISRVIVDESHCVSTWGHDFRNSYLKLGGIRATLLPSTPVTALTATATEVVQADIIDQLQLRDCKKFISSFFRGNLHLWSFERPPLAKFVIQLQKLIKKHKVGIIYCTTRAKCESFAEKLGISYYHAGMSNDKRKKIQEEWQQGIHSMLVATVAFGMGIDNSKVRFVVHANLPQSIEQYYQEIGRAGRDGHRADCYLFHSYSDKIVLQQMITKNAQQKQSSFLRHQVNTLIEMYRFANDSVNCKHRLICKTFNENIPSCGKSCQNCLTPDLTEKVDITVVSKDVFKLLMQQQISRAQIRQQLKRTYPQIEDILIFLILDKYLKEEVVPNYSGFWSEKLKLYKKSQQVISGNQSIYMNMVPNQKNLFNRIHTQQLIPSSGLEGKFIDCGMVAKGATGATVATVATVAPVAKVATVATVAPVYNQEELYHHLVKVRRALAKSHNCAAYMIFPNNTLREMSESPPYTSEDLLTIKGVGKIKCQKYGHSFLTAVEKYLGQQ